MLAAGLIGCVDAPNLDTVWKCHATFYCDEQPFEITPAHACVADEPEARRAFDVRLDELTRDAQCATKSFEVACEDTGRRCVR